MKLSARLALRRLPLLLIPAFVLIANAAYAASANDAATLGRIRDTAMNSNWSYERLADLTDLVGPRLSGSPGAAAAVEQVAQAMRQLGAKVTLQPIKVPHWVRGVETASLVDYTGRPAGLSQRVVLTALGGSGATPAAGLDGQVIIMHGMDELKARAAEVKDKIVLVDVPFDQHLADNGLAGPAYGRGSDVRFNAPPLAADHGAKAVLVRSIGGADFRLPHTGVTGLVDGKRIPAAAVTVEDALLISRLAARGPVTMHLTLTPQMLPDADSFNVIADWPGTDKADEVVVVSGHLDSWDLATGANDDGAGIISAMGVIETLKKLDLHAHRTIRVIAWMNEENGSRGAEAYLKSSHPAIERQIAAIESDNGAGRTMGITTSAPEASLALFNPLKAVLMPIGAGVVRRVDVLGTGDLHGLEAAGVPSFVPLVDASTYFHYHHTPADTLDKVDPQILRTHVATMATLSWFLANMEQPLGRTPVKADAH
jgi:carboxypeptidase Q